MAAAVTPCLLEYSITACLKRIVCVILFMANRVTPAFRFLFQQLNLNTGHSYSLSFFLSVTHHCNTYTPRSRERRDCLRPFFACSRCLSASDAAFTCSGGKAPLRPRIAGGDLPQGKRIPMVLWRENGSDQQKTVLLNLSFSRAVSLVLCNHSSEYCMKHDLVLNQYQQAK